MPRLTAGNTIVARYVVNALETSPHVESEQWQATDKIFGRDVYLYVIDSSIPSGAIDRARASAQLTVEGLARVVDVVDKGSAEKYIITERPAGVTTALAIAAAPFTLKQTKAVIGSVASSLAKAASGHNLYHGALTADSIFFKGLKVTLSGLVPRNFLGLNLERSPEDLARVDAQGLAALSYFMLTGLMSNYLSSEVSPLPRLADFLTDADGDVDAFTTDILNSDDSPVRSAQDFLDVLGAWSPDDLPFVDEDSVVKAPRTDAVPLPPAPPSVPQRKSARGAGSTVPGSQPVAKPAFGAVGAASAAGAGVVGIAGAGVAAAGAAGVASVASSAISAGSDAISATSSSDSDGVSDADDENLSSVSQAADEPQALESAAPPVPAPTEPTSVSATSSASSSDASEPGQADAEALATESPASPATDETEGDESSSGIVGKGSPESDRPEPDSDARGAESGEPALETQAHDLTAVTARARVAALSVGGPPRFLPTTHDRTIDQPVDLSASHTTQIPVTNGAASSGRTQPAYGAFAPSAGSAAGSTGAGSSGSGGSPSWPTAPATEKVKLTGFSATPWVLLFFLAILGFGGYWAVDALTAPTAPPIVAPTGRPTPQASDDSDPAAAPTEQAVIPVVKSAKSLDPMGDDNEHPELQDRLVDGDTTSEWYSRTYKTKAFGGIKKDGIGFALQLEQESTVNSLLISSQNTGGKVEIRATSADDPAGGELLASGKMDGETIFKFDKPAKTESIVVWFTEMPKDSSGKFRIYVYEASLA